MISLIKFIIFGHMHKWKIIKECLNSDNWTIYYLQCEKCGDTRRKVG